MLAIVISTWLFGLICGALVLACIFCFLLWHNLLPFPDRGSFIFTSPSLLSRKCLIELLNRYGIKPRFRADEPGKVWRAIYPSGLILNVVDNQMLREMGNPAGGFAIPCNNPSLEAQNALVFCKSMNDTTAKIHGPLEGGKVYLVSTSFLLSGVLVFRKPLHKMGKPNPGGTTNKESCHGEEEKPIKAKRRQKPKVKRSKTIVDPGQTCSRSSRLLR
jgi:hypothetical protein